MYLKEIEVNGFKSFADKLNITLDNEITCIVGPNGSGKSNIVDAVRWVLGEQSAKSLRGTSGMSDVIFSGSKTRNPQNVASVSLIFDNSDRYLPLDYNEVVVKRRLFRSGESEYSINNNKCRLKDITNLFMDSGIGKQSFNIISQGEVQKILSDSPYERRSIFEEAAGVLKYKIRKEEAVRKLVRVEQNLERILDILEELKRQVDPLRRQSKKAEKYIENKNNLEQIEVAFIVAEIDELNYHFQRNKSSIKILQDQIEDLNIHKENEQIEKIKLDILKSENLISELNKELLQLTKQKEEQNTNKSLLEERSKYLSDNINHNLVLKLNDDLLKLQSKIKTYELEIESDLKTKEELEIINTDYTNKYNQKQEEYKKLQSSLVDVNNKINNTNYEINKLTNVVENSNIIPKSVRSVLNNFRLDGINDIVSNVVSSNDEIYDALNIAISSFKNFVIVDNESSAKDAIMYLRNNKLGRATFLPRSVIKPRFIQHDVIDHIKSMPNVVGVLSDLLEYEKKYENIVKNLFGNVIITKTIDDANYVSKKTNNRYKIITLLGDVINVGGSISGGSLHKTVSIREEKQKLDNFKQDVVYLVKETKKIEENIKKVQDDMYTLEEKQRISYSNLYLEEQSYNRKVKELEELEKNYEDLSLEVKTSSGDLNILEEEEKKTLEKYYDIVNKLNEVSIKLEDESINKDNLNKTLDEVESLYKLNNQSLREKEVELKDLEVDISKMDIKLDNYLLTLNEDYEMTYEYAKNKYSLEIDKDEAKELVQFYKSNLRQIGMVNLEAIEEYKEVSTRYEFLLKQQTDLIEAKESLYEIINELDNVMEREFSKSFEIIEKEFSKVFKELFKGGNATLKLTDPNDLLNTGVDIIASPPGKKLSSISLLSGGEKTLTAISLLFAMLNVRNVPFCLFDEVEAALDDFNVDNFGKYLDNYKNKTQFLLITHKKKTMEYANTLYGITMQESGVSKLVSVKLENVKKDV